MSAVQAVLNTISGLIGNTNSNAISFKLISNLIQIIRFINIDYPQNLDDTLKTWSTTILNVNVPDKIGRQIVTKDIPQIFTRYGIEPDFLSNYWGTIIVLIALFASLITFGPFAYCLRQCQSKPVKYLNTLFKTLFKAALNFLIVLIYRGFGEVIFYTVLEIKSLSLKSTASNLSFALAMLILGLGISLFVLYWRFMIKYHKLKSNRAIGFRHVIADFLKRNEWLAALYTDFSDTTIMKHSFLFLMIVRDTLINLAISTMTSFPVVQTIILVCCSIFFCLYVCFYNPFKRRFQQLSQLFLEASVLIVYLCVLILGIEEPNKTSKNRERLGLTVIIINLLLNGVSSLLLVVSMVELAKMSCKAYKKKSVSRRALRAAMRENNQSRILIRPQPEVLVSVSSLTVPERPTIKKPQGSQTDAQGPRLSSNFKPRAKPRPRPLEREKESKEEQKSAYQHGQMILTGNSSIINAKGTLDGSTSLEIEASKFLRPRRLEGGESLRRKQRMRHDNTSQL